MPDVGVAAGARVACVECGAEVPGQAVGRASSCERCARPYGFCECGSAFPSLARFCGRCGRPVLFPDSDAAGRDPRAIREAFRPERRAAIALFGHHFECAPKLFRGFVWALSDGGEVLRLTPRNGEVSTLVSLGPGFGKSPLCIGYFPWLRASKMPVILAVSEKEIAGWSAASSEPHKVLAAAGSGERFLASMSHDCYVGVVGTGDRVCALLQRGDEVTLLSAGLPSGTEWRAPVCRAPVAGPLLIDERVCCYSETAVYYLNESRLEQFPLPSDVHLIVSPQETRGYRPPGDFPWVLAETGAYLPGVRGGLFGFVSLRFDERPACQFLAVDPNCSYSRSADGNLLVCRPGQLLLVERGGISPLHTDRQIATSGVEFLDSSLQVFAASTGAGTLLRARHPAFEQDFAMPRARGVAAHSRFLAAGDCFILPFFDQWQQIIDIGVAVWRL